MFKRKIRNYVIININRYYYEGSFLNEKTQNIGQRKWAASYFILHIITLIITPQRMNYYVVHLKGYALKYEISNVHDSDTDCVLHDI